MTRPSFPNPATQPSWRDHAALLQQELSRALESPDPTVIPLATLQPGMSAVTDGLLAFDRVAGVPVVSVGGVWRQIALVP